MKAVNTKKTIVEINLGNTGSTGKIMEKISALCSERNMRVILMYPSSKNKKKKSRNEYIICSKFKQKIAQKLYYYTGISDIWNKTSTSMLIRHLKRIKPDVVHLHNIHNNFLNIPALFSFLKKNKITVVWTLHDCWSFTGRCPHFIFTKCNQWMNGCQKCLLPREDYPHTKIDRTKKMWKMKKNWFLGVENMILVTPSKWLEQMVKQSFLRDYPVKVINNGIDLSIFKPTNSFFRKEHNISNDDFVILGISFSWGMKKGLDVFLRLSTDLPIGCKIVLVGTNNDIDKELPKNIISIHKTNNQHELTKIYSAANLFVNPTREDNFPTVNIEALACGIPVLTYNTGGSPEILNKKCGEVINYDDYDSLLQRIIFLKNNSPYKKEDCLKRANDFNAKDKFEDYIELFNEILEQ